MKKLLITTFLAGMIIASFAQDITGTWRGQLNVQGNKIKIIFHIKKTEAGYSATMDSPDQGANGLATDQTTFDDHHLVISAAKYGMIYHGTFLPDSDRIDGAVTQGQANIPVILTREKSDLSKSPNNGRRPQDPLSYPYKREEVMINNQRAGVQLAGTLTLPQGKKPSKIVILITGSGPQNRDEELRQFNHRPFLVWSDWLTRHGIAVLRYDDRGVAGSTGSFANATSADFAADAEAAVKYIQSRDDLKGISIGLMGHSEGGMIAPMVASCNPSIKFIVLLAGPGVKTTDLMLKQIDDQQRLNGTPPETARLNREAATQVFDFLNENKNNSSVEIKPEIERLLTVSLKKYPDEAFDKTKIKELVDQTAGTYLTPWFRYFITFDPAVYLTKVKCPVLALDGTLDSQVSCAENLNAIRTDLTIAGNKHFVILPLKNLNHLMQKATTGAVSEYSNIDETVDPSALEAVSRWLNQ